MPLGSIEFVLRIASVIAWLIGLAYWLGKKFSWIDGKFNEVGGKV